MDDWFEFWINNLITDLAPKTKSSYRTIPLTARAYNVLRMRDSVFINFRTGEPTKNSSYDTHLYKLYDEGKIKRFCMHALRHTYATRAIEGGVMPKKEKSKENRHI